MSYPISDHYDGNRFYNLVRHPEPTLWDVLRWQLFERPTAWEPSQISAPVSPNLPEILAPNQVAITYINHATLLIQLPKLNLLTDPIFSTRASPIQWFGPKRFSPPGLELVKLPKIDAVLISHNHYDHLDIPSLKMLAAKDNPLFMVPLGNARYLTRHGLNNVIELDWWQSHTVQDTQVYLTPAQHWSQRTPLDKFKALWGGFVIQNELTIYFAGDTGFGPHFQLIQEQFGKLDVALLPIGAYEPRWFMRYHHMNPKDAIQAYEILQARLGIGIHFGTFQLTNEAYAAPNLTLQALLAQHHLSEDDFIAPRHGQTLYFTQ